MHLYKIRIHASVHVLYELTYISKILNTSHGGNTFRHLSLQKAPRFYMFLPSQTKHGSQINILKTRQKTNSFPNPRAGHSIFILSAAGVFQRVINFIANCFYIISHLDVIYKTWIVITWYTQISENTFWEEKKANPNYQKHKLTSPDWFWVFSCNCNYKYKHMMSHTIGKYIQSTNYIETEVYWTNHQNMFI